MYKMELLLWLENIILSIFRDFLDDTSFTLQVEFFTDILIIGILMNIRVSICAYQYFWTYPYLHLDSVGLSNTAQFNFLYLFNMNFFRKYIVSFGQ